MNSINEVMLQSKTAFDQYKKLSGEKRAIFLEAIAAEIEVAKETLVPVAMEESHLPQARLAGEIGRTTGQLRLFASLIREGSWVEASIDTAIPDRVPPKPDIRKMLLPVGPVVVFGASNFPFAFSTAGGDTASALAAGCNVVIRGHFAHAKTSQLVFACMEKAAAATGMPAHTVQHVAEAGNEVGKALVTHPATKAVGFTGSFAGGRALMDYATQREIPIPVYAEMSSVNPVVFYPGGLATKAAEFAAQYAGSITLGVGQFCTNPGLLFAVKGSDLDTFKQALAEAITKVAPAAMLHAGIASHYNDHLEQAINAPGITVLAKAETAAAAGCGAAVVATASAKDFIANPRLADEIFGPYSLLVECESMEEIKVCLRALKGQLTSTIMGTEEDMQQYADVIELQIELAGRVIFNNVPTGVEVCASMVHGGPYPATSDARSTSVGSSAIKRFARPVAFQNYPAAMLPAELQEANPLGIWRLRDGMFGKS